MADGESKKVVLGDGSWKKLQFVESATTGIYIPSGFRGIFFTCAATSVLQGVYVVACTSTGGVSVNALANVGSSSLSFSTDTNRLNFINSNANTGVVAFYNMGETADPHLL